MKAGKLARRIIFQRATPSKDEYGEDVDGWDSPEQICEVWAQVFYGRGDERRQAAMDHSVQSATFMVRSSSDTRSVSITDRIVMNGLWDIVGIAPDTPKRGEMEFTATRGES